MKDDTISRAAAIKAADSIIERDTSGNNDVVKAMTAWKKFIEALPPAQPSVSKTEIVGDAISRQALLDAVEGVDWYHQNKNGEMVHGANSDEHQAWYKADDVYTAIESVPSAQPNLSEAYSKAVFAWLMDYQIRAAELKGRYTPYEVLSWVINDWRKEHERSD